MNERNPHLYELGKMTVFYIPSHKLDDPAYYQTDEHAKAQNQTARAGIHEFLIHHFRAYTQTPTPIKGCWMDPAGRLVHDVMERFEVSFSKEGDFDRLIEFLVETCGRLDEDAIYVTRGETSFLVRSGSKAC